MERLVNTLASDEVHEQTPDQQETSPRPRLLLLDYIAEGEEHIITVTIRFRWEEFQELFAMVQDCFPKSPPDSGWRWLLSIGLT
jgi:hypothetical protein